MIYSVLKLEVSRNFSHGKIQLCFEQRCVILVAVDAIDHISRFVANVNQCIIAQKNAKKEIGFWVVTPLRVKL